MDTQRQPIQQYVPQAVALHPDDSLRRRAEPGDLRIHIRPPDPLTTDEWMGFDTTTIFYDVFFEHGEGQLMAVGPPLLNLDRELLPVSACIVEGGRTHVIGKPRVKRLDGCNVYRFRFRPERISEPVTYKIRLEFATGFVAEVNSTTRCEQSTFLTLSTLQKDNDPLWVTQWVKYWSRLGVDRIILYDNGSSNWIDVLNELQKSGDPPSSVTAVAWHYPFGLVRSFSTRWAQIAALAHAQFAFQRSTWVSSFDIDEYFVVRDVRHRIPDILRETKPSIGVLKICPYSVPNVVLGSAVDAGLPVSARTFRYRERVAGSATKYFARPRALRFGRQIHTARVRPFRTIIADPSEISFFHFGGLTTGWKYPERLRQRHLDSNKFVEDQYIVQAFERLGICDES